MINRRPFPSWKSQSRSIILTSSLYRATPLPDEDAELVREAVELVVLVDAAAPHPQHVHVRLPRRVEQLQVVGLVVARRHRGRDPVGALHEDRPPVHAEVEGEAAAEGLLHQLQRAEGHLLGLAVDGGEAGVLHPDGEGVEGLAAVPVGPPELHLLGLHAHLRLPPARLPVSLGRAVDMDSVS